MSVEYVVEILLKAREQISQAFGRATNALNDLTGAEDKASEAAKRHEEAAKGQTRALQDLHDAHVREKGAATQSAQASRDNARALADETRSTRERINAARQSNRELVTEAQRLQELASRRVEEQGKVDRVSQAYMRQASELRRLASEREKEARGLEKEAANSERRINSLHAEAATFEQRATRAEQSASRVERAMEREAQTAERAAAREADAGRTREGSARRNEEQINRLNSSFQGFQIAFVIKYAQALLTALTGLAGGLFSVASAAGVAGATLAGAFAAGLAQAIPVAGLLGATLFRLTNVFQALHVHNQLALVSSHNDAAAKQRQASAADQVTNAEQRLQDAHRGVTNAEQQLADARHKLSVNEKDLTRARHDAQRQVEDLMDAEARAKLQAEGASLSLEEAQRRMRQAITGGDVAGTAQSELDVANAHLDVHQAVRTRTRAEQDANRARREGIKAIPAYQSAVESVRSSENGVRDAQRGVADAARQVTRAQHDLARAHTQAATAASQQTAQEDRLQAMLALMSPAERGLYNALVRMQNEIRKRVRPMTDIIVGAMTRAVDRMRTLLTDPGLTAAFHALATTVARQMDRISKFLVAPRQIAFFRDMTKEATRNAPIITNILLHLARTFENIARAASPALHALLRLLDAYAARAEKASSNTDKLSRFFSGGVRYIKAFIDWGIAAVKLMAALANAGGARRGLDTINAFTRHINNATRWVDDHRRKVDQFFHDSARVMSMIARVLFDIGKEIIGAFNVSNVSSFTDFMETVLIPALGNVIQIMGVISGLFHYLLSLPLVNTIAQWAATILLLTKGLLVVRGALTSIRGLAAVLVPAIMRLGGTAAAAAEAAEIAFAPWLAIVVGIGTALVVLDRKLHFLRPIFDFFKENPLRAMLASLVGVGGILAAFGKLGTAITKVKSALKGISLPGLGGGKKGMAAEIEAGGKAAATTIGSAIKTAGTAVAERIREALNLGGKKAAAEQKAGVAAGGTKAAAEQEAGVAAGGTKSAAAQEAGVAAGGRVAASEEEAGVAAGGAVAAEEIAAGVAGGGAAGGGAAAVGGGAAASAAKGGRFARLAGKFGKFGKFARGAGVIGAGLSAFDALAAQSSGRPYGVGDRAQVFLSDMTFGAVPRPKEGAGLISTATQLKIINNRLTQLADSGNVKAIENLRKNIAAKVDKNPALAQALGTVDRRAAQLLNDMKGLPLALKHALDSINRHKFADEGALMEQLRGSLKGLPRAAREKGAEAMIELSRTMERQGRVPKGTTNKLIKDIVHQWGDLAPGLRASGHQSLDAINSIFKGRRALSGVRNFLNQAADDFAGIPHMAKINFAQLPTVAGPALDRLEKLTHSKNKAIRDRAKKDYDSLSAAVEAAQLWQLKHSRQHWDDMTTSANKKSGNMVGKVLGNFLGLDTGVKDALGNIKDNVNKSLGSFGGKKIGFTLGSAAGALAAQLPKNAEGDWHSRAGQRGKIVRIAEGGYDEVVLTTDPKHRVRQEHLLAQYLARTGMLPSMLERSMPEPLSRALANSIPSHARGGFVHVPGDPRNTGNRDIVNAAIAAAVSQWIKAFHLDIGYAYDPGGGHHSPGHNITGTALDVVPGPGGSWDLLERGLKWAIARGHVPVYYGTHGIGTPLANHGRGNHAHVEWGLSGALSRAIAGAAGITAQHVERQMLKGPAGPLRRIGQGAIDKVTDAANKYIDKKSGAIGGPIGNLPANAGQRQWARALLRALGIAPSSGAMQSIMRWELAEGGNWNNAARFNPLNTTMNLPGHVTGAFGAPGIKAYDSWASGLRATVATLRSYPTILAALRSGSFAAFRSAVLSSHWGTTSLGVGGVVPGSPGQPMAAIVHGNEWVLNDDQKRVLARLAGIPVEALKRTVFKGSGTGGTAPGHTGGGGGWTTVSGTGTGQGRGTASSTAPGSRHSLGGVEFSDATKEIDKSLRDFAKALNKKGNITAKKIRQTFADLTADGGPFDRMNTAIENFVKNQTSALQRAEFRIDKKGGTHRLLDPLKVMGREFKLLRDTRSLLNDESVRLDRAMDDAHRALHRAQQLSGKERTKAVNAAKAAIANLRTRQSENSSQIAQNAQDMVEKQEEIQNRQVQEVNDWTQRAMDGLDRTGRALTALGINTDPNALLGKRKGLIQRQINKLTKLQEKAAKSGNEDLALQLDDQIQELRTQITEIAQQMLQNTIDAVNKSAADALELNDARQSLAQIGTTNYGALGAALQDRGRVLQNQRSGLVGVLGGEGALAALRALPFDSLTDSQRDLIKQITGLDVSIAQNTQAVKDNTNAAVQASIDLVNSTSDFLGGVTGGASSFYQALATLTGTDQTGALIPLATLQGANLRTQQTGLKGMLASLLGYSDNERSGLMNMSGAELVQYLVSLSSGPVYDAIIGRLDETQRGQFQALVTTLVGNTQAITENTTNLKELTGQITGQGWSSTAWQWFRNAVFTGSGGLLPQFRPPMSHSGSIVTKSGVVDLEIGQRVLTTSERRVVEDGATGADVFAPHIENVERVVDMDAETLSNRLMHRYKTRPKARSRRR